MKILKFYADWCGPCRLLSNRIESVKEECKDIEIISIDVSDNEDLVQQYKISSIPVLVKLDSNGVELDRKTGVIPLSELKEFILDTE